MWAVLFFLMMGGSACTCFFSSLNVGNFNVVRLLRSNLVVTGNIVFAWWITLIFTLTLLLNIKNGGLVVSSEGSRCVSGRADPKREQSTYIPSYIDTKYVVDT